MIHTFSGCVLGSAVECDLDELLATRLVSFLMDHQQNILSVPEYLLNAINGHVRYLRSVQVHTVRGCMCHFAFWLHVDKHLLPFLLLASCFLLLVLRQAHSRCFDLRSPFTVIPALTTPIRPAPQCPYTRSAVRSAAPSLSSRSWPLPSRPWRSCWRCWWRTKASARRNDTRNSSRWVGKDWLKKLLTLIINLLTELTGMLKRRGKLKYAAI